MGVWWGFFRDPQWILVCYSCPFEITFSLGIGMYVCISVCESKRYFMAVALWTHHPGSM